MRSDNHNTVLSRNALAAHVLSEIQNHLENFWECLEVYSRVGHPSGTRALPVPAQGREEEPRGEGDKQGTLLSFPASEKIQ